MKVPVFLRANMELIGVVVVSDHNLQNIAIHGGYLSFHKWDDATTVLGMNKTFDPIDAVVQRIDLQAVPIGRDGARSFFLLADRRTDLGVLHKAGRQLWPRARDKRYKKTKAERKYYRNKSGPPRPPYMSSP